MKRVLTSAFAAERQLTDTVSSITATTAQLRGCYTRHQLRRLYRLRHFAKRMIERIESHPLDKRGDTSQ
jgi:hypothetical protein